MTDHWLTTDWRMTHQGLTADSPRTDQWLTYDWWRPFCGVVELGRCAGCTTTKQRAVPATSRCLMDRCTLCTYTACSPRTPERWQWLPATHWALRRTRPRSRSTPPRRRDVDNRSNTSSSDPSTVLLDRRHHSGTGTRQPVTVRGPPTLNIQSHRRSWRWCPVRNTDARLTAFFQNENDCVKKCMDHKVEGVKPRGRPQNIQREVAVKDCCSWVVKRCLCPLSPLPNRARQHGWTDGDAVWNVDTGGPKEPRIR